MNERVDTETLRALRESVAVGDWYIQNHGGHHEVWWSDAGDGKHIAELNKNYSAALAPLIVSAVNNLIPMCDELDSLRKRKLPPSKEAMDELRKLKAENDELRAALEEAEGRTLKIGNRNLFLASYVEDLKTIRLGDKLVIKHLEREKAELAEENQGLMQKLSSQRNATRD